jgi:hypothetical protein
LCGIFFWTGVSLLCFSWFRGDDFPAPAAVLPTLSRAPEQTAIQRAPFDVTVAGKEYRISPLYRYDLTGLVVSLHHADSWLDYAHQEWGDALNIVDLCVVWGKNATSGIYEEMRFSHGQWTCYYQTRDQKTWERFSESEISNNHLLTNHPAIRRKIRSARIGDQIRLVGFLAEYAHGDFRRGTSTTRTDTGNGACETVWVEGFDILRRPPAYGRVARWLGYCLIALAAILWFRLPPNFGRK